MDTPGGLRENEIFNVPQLLMTACRPHVISLQLLSPGGIRKLRLAFKIWAKAATESKRVSSLKLGETLEWKAQLMYVGTHEYLIISERHVQFGKCYHKTSGTHQGATNYDMIQQLRYRAQKLECDLSAK